MHTLMSFVGCVGTLIAESELYEIMESMFGEVSKMLNGIKFPKNMHALRSVVEELLRPLFNTEYLTIIMTWIELLKMWHVRAEQLWSR